VSRPPTSSPSPTSSGGPDDRPGRSSDGMPGSKALAWAVVGLAAFRKRKDQSAVHKASVDPFRPRPPRAHGPGSNGQVATSEPGVHAARAANSAGTASASDTPASNGAWGAQSAVSSSSVASGAPPPARAPATAP